MSSRLPSQAMTQRTDVLFALFFVIVVVMMILPLPTVLIDAMLAFNLALSFVVLVTAIYLKNVLDISTFPSVILIGTVFRLALTISTTRLILSRGDAGEIIQTFGSFVVAGNIVVGLVMFLIVALVQFIVVTKGAERIAEVSARFTLDAIPGKQLAIDSDVRNGHITPEAAQKRRTQLERESQFFGAMDGAMRFVKGDAIAGLVIVAVNLLGGLAIGIFQRGMSFSGAVQLYSLLSIGDGLVAQIPSMLMAVAAGVVVTRVSADESAGLGTEISRQLVKEPRALGVAAAMTLVAAFVPGFPAVVLLPLGLGLAGIAAVLTRGKARGSSREGADSTTNGTGENGTGELQPLDRTKFGDPIVATLSPATLQRLESEGLATKIDLNIKAVARTVGVAVTVPTFQADPRMGDHVIHVSVENVPAGLVDCTPGRHADMVARDIVRIVRRHVGSIFSVEDLTQWLKGLEPRLGRLASDVHEQVPPMLMIPVMRLLIDSGVPLSQPRMLLEAMLANFAYESNPELLAERARHALGKQIAFAHLDNKGLLPAIALGVEWGRAIQAFNNSPNHEAETEANETLRGLVEETSRKLADANAAGRDPVALVDGEIRLLSQGMMIKHGCRIPVIAVQEIDERITVDVVANVGTGLREAA